MIAGLPEPTSPYPEFTGANIYGGSDILARLQQSQLGYNTSPLNETQIGYMPWTQLEGINDYQAQVAAGGNPLDGTYSKGVFNYDPSMGAVGGGTVNPDVLASYLDSKGYQIGQWFGGDNEDWRWIQDAQGNYVVKPQNYATDDKMAMLAALAAAGVVMAPTMMAGMGSLGGGSAAGLEAAIGVPELGMVGQTGLTAGTAGTTAAGAGGLSFTIPEAGSLGGGSLGGSFFDGSAGMSTSWWDKAASFLPSNVTDWAKLGTTLYGTYKSGEAMDQAGDAANRALDISQMAATRQADLAEATYRNYLEKIQPGLLSDAEFARQRAGITAGQSDELFRTQMSDAEKYRTRYWGTQIPREDQVYGQAERMGSADWQEMAAGRDVADYKGRVSMAMDGLKRDQQRRGWQDGSGAAVATATDAVLSAALGESGVATDARRKAVMDSMNLKTSLNALGRGLPGFVSGSAGGATSAGNLSLSAGALPAQAGAQSAAANTAAMRGVSDMWNSSVTAASTGANAVNRYADLVNNSPLSTIAGYGWSGWLGNGG